MSVKNEFYFKGLMNTHHVRLTSSHSLTHSTYLLITKQSLELGIQWQRKTDTAS